MSESLHTELPWVEWSEEGRSASGTYLHSVCWAPNGYEDPHECVAEARGKTPEIAHANANLIVTACNNHARLMSENAALREALEYASDRLCDMQPGLNADDPDDLIAQLVVRINDALAKP